MSSNQRRFRLLQENNSGAARMHHRRRLWLKVVVGVAVVVFAGAAFGAIRNAKSLYTANVIVNYHKAAAETNHRKLMGSGNGGDASSGPAVIIKSGISLDHVGDMVLDNPQHLLCDMHLYFVESAPDMEGLSVPLQRGKVMSVRETPSFNECCNSCSAAKCHGFRYVGTECAHLEFPKVDLPELDFQKTMKQSYFTKQKAAALAERHHNAQLARLAKRDKEGAKLNLNAAETSDTQGPAPTDDTDSNQRDESLELLFEDSSAQGADEQVTDSSGNEENQQEEDELDFSFDDSPGESENSKPNVKQRSEEAALDFSVSGDGSSAASADEPSTMDASPVETETSAPISEISMATAPASGDLGAKLLDGLKVDGAVGSIEALPAALQEIDHSDETEELREALGSKEAEATTSQLSDQELMDKLMDQVNNRHNQLNAAPEGDEKKKKRDTTSEIQLDHDFNLELGRTRLKKIIPLGDYNRLTARDPVFDKHKTFWLRYRSNREMQSVAFDLARAHSNVKFTVFGKSGDRKKPQPLRSLRVGNGRRGKHIFVVASLRGCEWTGSLAVLHTAMILKGRGPTTKKLLDSVQFHFISLANPDGFDYSHQKSPSNARTWCKNRRVAVPGYHGVDLEHNWGLDGISWGFGKRDGAKLDNFQGPANFSEPETRHLRDYIKHYSTGRGRVAVLQIRCCAGSITPPQIYNPRSMNPINVVQVAEAMARQIETTDGSRYNVIQRETEFHSKNTGQMIDWAYNEANVDHAYVVDVKGSGLATRADHHKISIEPFQVLLRELEMAAAFTALKLLQMPIEGDAVNAPYKYKGSFGSTSDSSSKSSDKSSKSSDKGSSNHSGKGSSKDHSKGKDHGKSKRKK